MKIPPPLPPADGFSSHQPFPRRILIDDDTSSPSSLILRCVRLPYDWELFILTLTYFSAGQKKNYFLIIIIEKTHFVKKTKKVVVTEILIQLFID